MNSISFDSKFHYTVLTTNTVVLIVQRSVFVFGIWAARVGGKTFNSAKRSRVCLAFRHSQVLMIRIEQ